MTAPEDSGKTPNSENQSKAPDTSDSATSKQTVPTEKPTEHGGPKGPDPTRYQDWERGGRCVDF